VHIGVGGTVQWRSNSGLLHSVTPVGHALWESVETDGRGVEMLEVQFLAPGTYEFQCNYHWEQGMVGRVVVAGSD
jgi:plastocyanin